MGGKLRFRFSKVGRIKFISHLDLMATMRRALLRAGVRLEYSEGFNPHPYMSAALPLSVGQESLCELLDVGVSEGLSAEGLPAIITAELPEGLEILEAYAPGRKFGEIKWVEISGALYYDKEAPPEAAARLSERFGKESIIVRKKTKRGLSDLDIAPFVRDIGFECDGGADAGYGAVRLGAKISAQNPTVNPELLVSSLEGEYSGLMPAFSGFTRVEVFDSGMNAFR